MNTEELRRRLVERVADLAAHLLPAGKRIGNHWCVGDVNGTPGDSFKVCLSGPKAGLHGDFASSEKHSSSPFDLWSAVRRVDFKTAQSESAAWLGVILDPLPDGRRDEAGPLPGHAPAAERPKPTLPPMDAGTDDELHQLAALRKVSFHAIHMARAEGVHLLRFATLKGHRAWIVTDAEGLNAQARRLDGGTWDHLGGAKAYTLPGCRASWPLGAKAGERYPKFALTEGGPDMLAALHFIIAHRRESDVFPVAMLGAGQRIHEDALPFFAGKRVRIFPHDDKPGRDGSERWAAQLAEVGADVDCFAFAGLRKADGSPVNDLNDCTAIHPEDAGELEGLLP